MSDEAARFFYDSFELMYKTYSQKFDKTTVTAFMSQEEERMKQFSLYGGYKIIEDWKNLCNIEDFRNYYDIVKKYSLIRECDRSGYPVEKIMKYRKFDEMSAKDVYKMLRSKLDSIHTVILSNEDIINIADGMSDAILKCVDIPDVGISMPYKILSDSFKGIMKSIMLVMGMLSNDGKTRFLAKMAAYIAFFHKEKVLVMLNETTEKEFRHCIFTTVINNEEFQKIHGIKLNKNEREIALGRYKNDSGEFIERYTDENGVFIESLEDFQKRLNANSFEFRNVMAIAEWFEKESEGIVYIKEMIDYEDATLEFEIRKHHLTKNIDYFMYDTLKSDNDTIGEWAALKKTATMLSELCKELNIFLYGSIQMTDDAVNLSVFDLTSMNIANCKQIKHLVDQLCLTKRIPKTDYGKYRYIPTEAWGEPIPLELNPKKIYYGCKVDKNRQGEKPIVIFEVDLNQNKWIEVGELVRASKQ